MREQICFLTIELDIEAMPSGWEDHEGFQKAIIRIHAFTYIPPLISLLHTQHIPGFYGYESTNKGQAW